MHVLVDTGVCMDRDRGLKVVLLALTGFGNTVLQALLQDTRVEVEAVFTSKYDRPFPYYRERQLSDLCRDLHIDCYHGLQVCSDEGIGLLRAYSPDLIIVATFKQIIRKNALQLPALGVVNYHPSLLPRYRGPCPTNAALFNDEKVTGITVHYVTEYVDEGDILLQRSLNISETDNDGRLRYRLAKLAGDLTPELVGMFAGFTRPVGKPQAHGLASSAPKPTVEDGYLEQAADVDAIRRRVRAFNPLPGTSILVGGARVAVDRFEMMRNGGLERVWASKDAVEVNVGGRAIRLFKRAD